MKRHVIVGHFGPLDRTAVQVTDGEIITYLNLVASQRRLDYGIGRALDDLRRVGVFPSEMGLDILILAAHVHAADTRISRVTESQDTWTREIRLVVPVSDPARWATATPVVKRMLDFLTGDRWTLDFRPRPAGFAKVIYAPFQRPVASRFNSLALFSGGLDSLIGAIDALERNEIPLFVSHVGEGATSAAQYTCFEALRRHYKGRRFDRLRVSMSFPEGFVRNTGSESTTRGRSFLFIAIGVFAGTGLGGDFTLRVPENGLIALNVPLDPLRLGSLSTRTTHPFYLARWNELLHILHVPGRIENPYWDKTKGEMVAACGNLDLLRQLIPSSLSCSSPMKGRWQKRGIEHCGYCLPCLIRRAAIETGLGHGSDSTAYTLSNLAAYTLDTRQAEGQQVRSFQFAIQRLRNRPELAKLFVHKPGPLSDEPLETVDVLARVYQRGMEEVATLLAEVTSKPS
jgi:hypothetical protein